MMASSSRPAISVRAAISVIGGMVATPSLMNVYDAPHSVASSASNAKSIAWFDLCGFVMAMRADVLSLSMRTSYWLASLDNSPGVEVFRPP